MADNNAIVNTEPTVVDTENPADELESGASGINPVVNTSPTTSETPSNLVKKGEDDKLSPNPAGFGFTKQVTVNTLSSPGSPDTLYLVPQYDGEGRVKEYYKYKWDVAAFAFERIFEPVNNVKFEEGEHATPVHENVSPKRAPEKVFNGDVVFNGEVYDKDGKIVSVEGNPTRKNGIYALNPLSVLKIGDKIYDVVNSDYPLYFRFNRNAKYTVDTASNYASYIRILDTVIYFVVSFSITKTASDSNNSIEVGAFHDVPAAVNNRLYAGTFLDTQNTRAFIDEYSDGGEIESVVASTALIKKEDGSIALLLDTTNLEVDQQYHIRYLGVFLLTANHLVASGCLVSNLGDSDPTKVVFSKASTFVTEQTAWEEVIVDGNVFAKFTPWYKKAIYSGSELIGYEISDTKEDDDFHVYDCFLDENGNTLPYILIGRYCSSSTETINSVNAGRATATIGAWRTLAQAKGTGYQIMDAAMQIFWRDLALAISENVNFNNGSGVASYLGLARMTEGGWWIDGLTHVSEKYLYCSKPSKYVDQPTAATDGYDELSYPFPTNNGYCVSKLGYDPAHPTVNFPSAGVNNSSFNTYYCDGVYYASGNRPCGVNVGAASADTGLFYLYGGDDWSYAYGARLCYKPSIQQRGVSIVPSLIDMVGD